MKKLNSLLLLFTVAVSLSAQNWIEVHTWYEDGTWTFPYRMDHFTEFDFSDDEGTLRGYYNDADGVRQVAPFSVEYLDSIKFVTEPDSFPKNPYKVFGMNITTVGGLPITSKEEYVDCYVSVDGRGEYKNYSGTARIRGRGNSTWAWYDKKPYRIKLDVSEKILGIKKNRDWVLLANYRDPTDFMNTFAFEAARWMGLPFSNHTRYVEVFLNGDYIGVYQLTEQVEQGGHRVDINENGGVLLSFDLDDGPELSPDATDNFFSEVFNLPMCVKFPDDPTAEQIAQIKADFAVLENAIKDTDYEAADSLMDIKSLIDYLQLQEYIYNVELRAPRSMYMFRDVNGKYTFGPVWDCDGGYEFNWGNMYTGHDYFASYKSLLMGSDPYRYSAGVPQFFVGMFGCRQFVEEYKRLWAERSDSIFLAGWAECEKFLAHLKEGAIGREESRWPIGKSTLTEVDRLKTWLSQRKDYLNDIVAAYSIPTSNKTRFCGTVKTNVTMSYAKGYSQSVKVEINPSEVAALMSISTADLASAPLTILPLHRDGTIGSNNTNGYFGGWFNADGNPYDWGQGHVYIEVFDNLFSWNCGLRNEWGYCEVGHTHTVTMQLQYPGDEETLTVNVDITFTIAQ